MKAGTDLRDVITFRRMNLNDDMWSLEPHAQFDVVFCRNVLMYFEAGRRERVLRKILTRLPPRGYLFLGDAEGLGNFEGLRMVAPSTYALKTNTEPLRPRSDGDGDEKAAR